jgi:hypothetical protein
MPLYVVHTFQEYMSYAIYFPKLSLVDLVHQKDRSQFRSCQKKQQDRDRTGPLSTREEREKREKKTYLQLQMCRLTPVLSPCCWHPAATAVAAVMVFGDCGGVQPSYRNIKKEMKKAQDTTCLEPCLVCW